MVSSLTPNFVLFRLPLLDFEHLKMENEGTGDRERWLKRQTWDRRLAALNIHEEAEVGTRASRMRMPYRCYCESGEGAE
jgi:hypothetical protein